MATGWCQWGEVKGQRTLWPGSNQTWGRFANYTRERERGWMDGWKVWLHEQINSVFSYLYTYFCLCHLLLFKKAGIRSYTVDRKVSVILINTCYLYIVKYKHLSYFISLLFLNCTVFMTAYPRKSPSGICTNNKLTSILLYLTITG